MKRLIPIALIVVAWFLGRMQRDRRLKKYREAWRETYTAGYMAGRQRSREEVNVN